MLQAHLSPRAAARFAEAVEAVMLGSEAGSIRNAVLIDAKQAISRALDDAWEKHVQRPYFWANYDGLAQPLRDLSNDVTVTCLHDVLAASKRLAKTTVQAPAVNAMRALVAEAMPLALAVSSLKDKVTKGRAPSTGPGKPVNKYKVIKTCPVCFRPIAVVSGTMALHGYKCPASGWQTASCAGVRFEPLEVSSDGLAWLLGKLREQLAISAAMHANRESEPDHLLAKRTHKGSSERIMHGDPLWPRAYAAFVGKLEQDIRVLGREIPELEKRLAEWQPEAQTEPFSQRQEQRA